MTETGNSGIRALLQKSFIRIPLKLALWLIVFAAVTFVGALAYNAFDEELSAEAKALLAAPPMGAIDDQNGYIAFLGMAAPKERDQMEWGRKAAAAFTAQAQPGFIRTPEWKEAIRSHVRIPEAQQQGCKPESAIAWPKRRMAARPSPRRLQKVTTPCCLLAIARLAMG